MTKKIVAALSITLTAGEADKVSSKGPTNVAAYDAFLQGWSHFIQDTPESLLKAIPSFEKVVKLDPDYGRPYAALAALYYAVRRREWWLEWNMSHYEPPRLMHEYVQKALKSPTALAHSVASFNAIDNGRHEEGILEAERAIALDVNDPSGYLHMAYALTMAGRPQEAIPYVENAIRLNPHHPPKYF